MKIFLPLMLLAAWLGVFPSYAARRDDASARAISRLQTMVREATAERDRLKRENAVITAELDKAKQELEQGKSAKLDLEDKLNQELAAHKLSAEQSKTHLDNTTARLREVIEKYNALNKSKNELAAGHLKLQNEQQFTASELKACEHKNVIMFEGAKEIIDGYERCQNKNMFQALFNAEPITGIKNVEFENIIQEYEDKLRKGKYRGAADNKSKQ